MTGKGALWTRCATHETVGARSQSQEQLSVVQQLSIPIPVPDEGETIDIRVASGRRSQLLRYRIEAVRFAPDADAHTRVEHLRTFVRHYDPAWTLVQIGAPGGNAVPLTFRQRISGTQGADDAGEQSQQ